MNDKPEPAKRMTLSQIVEQLLQRGGGGGSSVSLTRNAKGETQIEVVVRTGDTMPTVEEACQVAQDLYDKLRRTYPMASGYVGATTSDATARKAAAIARAAS